MILILQYYVDKPVVSLRYEKNKKQDFSRIDDNTRSKKKVNTRFIWLCKIIYIHLHSQIAR